VRAGAALALFAAQLAAGTAQAAWTEEPGHGLVILNTTASRSSGRYEKLEVAPYLQFGLAEGMTAILQPTWSEISTTDDAGAGLSKVFAGARLRLWQDAAEVVSLQPGLTLSPFDQAQSRLRGGGDSSAELRLLWGCGFAEPFEGFVVAEAAPLLSLGGDASLLEADLTLGFRLDAEDLAMVQFVNKLPLDGGPGGYRKHQVVPSLVQDLGLFGLSLQMGLPWTYAGEDIPREIGVSAALWLRF